MHIVSTPTREQRLYLHLPAVTGTDPSLSLTEIQNHKIKMQSTTSGPSATTSLDASFPPVLPPTSKSLSSETKIVDPDVFFTHPSNGHGTRVQTRRLLSEGNNVVGYNENNVRYAAPLAPHKHLRSLVDDPPEGSSSVYIPSGAGGLSPTPSILLNAGHFTPQDVRVKQNLTRAIEPRSTIRLSIGGSGLELVVLPTGALPPDTLKLLGLGDGLGDDMLPLNFKETQRDIFRSTELLRMSFAAARPPTGEPSSVTVPLTETASGTSKSESDSESVAPRTPSVVPGSASTPSPSTAIPAYCMISLVMHTKASLPSNGQTTSGANDQVRPR